jgi:cob(I)alamin adenosyltransferase
MSIATRTGDDGTTGFLFGQRVPKNHPQIEAVGAFDELNVALGMIKPHLGQGAADAELRTLILTLQRNLIALMGEVACAETDAARYAASKFDRLSEEDVQRLDQAVATLETRGMKVDGWATPGANARAATLDMARVLARRAERQLSTVSDAGRTVRPVLRQFVNRLSDLLWLLARDAEQ